MGEKRIKEFLTMDELSERYGFSKSFIYQNSKALDAAKVRFNGRPLKPFRFDVAIVEQLIKAEPQNKVERERKVRTKSRIALARATKKTGTDDESWR